MNGGPPLPLFDDVELSTMPVEVREAASIFNSYRHVVVRLALTVADLLDAVEQGTLEDPNDPRLPGFRSQAHVALAELRETLQASEAEETRVTTLASRYALSIPGI